MRKFAIIFGLLIGLIWVAAALAAEEPTLLVLGRAPLGDNEAAAKDRAVADALARAVGRSALEALDPASAREKLGQLDRQIVANARQFVSTYTLKAAAPSDKTMLALVAVRVDAAALARALVQSGLKAATSSLPRTLVLVSQEAAPGRPPVFWWSGVPGLPAAPAPLARALAARGVSLVEPSELEGRVPPELKEAVLNEEQAQQLLRLSGAGMVILGRVRTYPLVSPQGSDPPPVAQIMALGPESLEPLGVQEEIGPVYHAAPDAQAGQKVDEAVEDAARRLLAEVSAGQAAQMVQAPAKVELRVAGFRSLADLNRFERVLQGMTAVVESMERTSVAPGRAVILLRLKVPAARLADELLLQDFGGLVANVVEATPAMLEVMLVPRREVMSPAPQAQEGRSPATLPAAAPPSTGRLTE